MAKKAITSKNYPPTRQAQLSIREVARLASVSPSTVSRILNDPEKNIPFAAKTRERVVTLCGRVGYQPNIHAKRLFSKQSNVIAVVVPASKYDANIVTPSNFDRTLSGFSDEAEIHRQDILLITVNARFFEERKYLTLFQSRTIDGLLAWGALWDHHYLSDLHAQGYPVVLAVTHLENTNLPHVIANDFQGSQLLAKHLLSLGHRRLAYIAGPSSASVAVQRHEGFIRTCREAGAKISVREGEFTYQSGYQFALDLLAAPKNKRPTAIAGANDVVAIGILEAAMSQGLSIPKDLSVAGADQQQPLYNPRLTTLCTPVYNIGRQSVKLLIQKINDSLNQSPTTSTKHKIILDTTLEIGKTTGPVPNP